MLKSIRLENFQAHKDLTVQFGPGITSIKGPTDAGKSAILRALRWVCLNDLSGDEFIREGAKRAVVTLTLANGRIIRRIRGGSVNSYELDGEEYRAFGRGAPPQDIAALLNLTELNFQGQHDSPFWFNETAGEVSRQLNSIIDLSVIDSSLGYAAGQVRNARERQTLVEERLVQAQEELTRLEPQRSRIQDFQILDQQKEQLEKIRKHIGQLEEIIGQTREHRAQIQTSEDRVADGNEVLGLGRTARELESRTALLTEILETADRLSLKTMPPNFTPIDRQFSELETVLERASDLEAILNAITLTSRDVERKEQEAKDAEKQFHNEVKGQKCPLCQAVI